MRSTLSVTMVRMPLVKPASSPLGEGEGGKYFDATVGVIASKEDTNGYRY